MGVPFVVPLWDNLKTKTKKYAIAIAKDRKTTGGGKAIPRDAVCERTIDIVGRNHPTYFQIPNATDSHSGSTPKSEDSGSSGNSNGSVNGGNDDMSLDNSPEIPDIRGEGERSSGSNSSLPEKSLVELDVPSVTPSIECGLIRAGYKLQSSCPPPAVRPLDALREKRAREDSEEHECRMKLLRKQSELCNLEIELVRQKIEAHSKAEEKVSELHQLKRTVAEWKRKLLEHETAERTLRVRHAEEEHKLRIAALQPQPTGLQ